MKRISQTKLNILSVILMQIVSGICGLILPRFVLAYFGSEVNGLVASVAQLLGYAVLLEGGIGGVMKAALYKQLANRDDAGISGVFYEISRVFRKISVIYLLFAFLLSVCMKFIVHTQYDWLYVFTIVLILSAHTYFNYYVGLPYRLLIAADQKLYIIQFTLIFVTVLNLLLCLSVMQLGGGIHSVKLTSVVIAALSPLVQYLYVKRHYNLSKKTAANTPIHIQKRDGAIHHIAYFIHRNTDIVILSLLGSLNIVSVYAVYSTVIQVLENFVNSFSSALSGLIGNLVARKDIDGLNRIVDRYEACNNALATAVSTVCTILILPFVAIYTSGITEVQYRQPLFAVLLIAGSYAYSIRHPFGCVVSTAGHYKETKFGAVGEVVINLGLSLLLVKPLGLIGVALGTFVAMFFRTLYTVWYLSKHILCRPMWKFLLKLACNVAASVALIIFVPDYINTTATSILGLLVCAVKVSLVVFPLIAVVNILLSLELIKKELRKS